jgi:hypothetical protein
MPKMQDPSRLRGNEANGHGHVEIGHSDGGLHYLSGDQTWTIMRERLAIADPKEFPESHPFFKKKVQSIIDASESMTPMEYVPGTKRFEIVSIEIPSLYVSSLNFLLSMLIAGR